MDERDWWIELEGRINMAESNGLFHEVKLTFDEVREIIKLLQELDGLKPCEYDPFKEN